MTVEVNITASPDSADVNLSNISNSVTIEFAGVIGMQGEQGIPGPSGLANLEYPAAIAISGNMVCTLNDSGQVIYADNTILSHAIKVMGISCGGVSIGGTVYIQPDGAMTEPSWNWTLDLPIFLSVNGLMTQTPPSAGFSMIVGFPISSTSMIIVLHDPIIL